MIHTLFTSFRISLTYGINTFIYRLRKLPVLKNLLSTGWYKNQLLKNGITAWVLLFRFVSIFVKKFLYFSIMAFLPAKYLPGNMTSNYVHIVLVFALTGAVMNTELFDASKDKYYSVVLMRMDSKEVALSGYFFYLCSLLLTMLPASIVIGAYANVPILFCLLLPVLTVTAKLTFSAIYLRSFETTGKVIAGSSNVKFIWTLILISLFLGYGLPALSFVLPGMLLVLFTILFLLTAVFSVSLLKNSRAYHRLYKRILTQNTILFNVTESVAKNQQQGMLSHLTLDVKSSKHGYDYLNDIFLKRHRKLLTVSAIRLSVFLSGILVLLIILVFVNQEVANVVNRFLMNLLPYFVFILYLMNRGSVITQAMFFNCDHSMLAYRFYRQPNAILSLFQSRLKLLVSINLMPASLLAFGLPVLLFLSGGTEQWINYLLLPISIFAMSVFFSIHHLVLYYLLQPYNINMEQKSHTYALAGSITYIVCYLFIRLHMPTLIFASLTIVFCVIYTILALYLVYRFAPKTFHLKQ